MAKTDLIFNHKKMNGQLKLNEYTTSDDFG
jgi:hypothetical protein